ncbi:extracellular solute-binding protein [Cohnella ginsengisoli]|uniref:Extracellular solute-binding protein n=1 Tax=Cohnella ginsengisoli TaxID=425004 RepID=A0A9X4KGG7_9BACL|nr:extracellular solute-binding protein [Cohnella ginsengisoli]MDG0791545.1 extracellular solute-binding protein [Cohnella ginsengisoli]
MKKSKMGVLNAGIPLLLTAGLLAGCGGNNNNGNNAQSASPSASSSASASATAKASDAPAKQDVTITMTAASGDTWIRDIDKEIIQDFTAETGIKIDLQIVPADQYASVLKTKLASGESADISLIWPEANAAQFLPDNNFLDLSGEPWVSTLTDAAKKNGSYNGKFIGWGPAGEDGGWGVLYNKELFDKLSIGVPKTFDEFLAACEKIQASGVIPIFEPLKDSWHSGIWMSLMGPQANAQQAGLYEGLNSNKATFASSKVFETFVDQYKTLYDKGYFGKEAFSNTYDKGMAALQSGKYAMFMVPANQDVQAKASNPDFDFTKFAEFPSPFADNKKLAVYDGTIIRVINKNSKKIDAAKAYLSYISREDVLKKVLCRSRAQSVLQGDPGDHDRSGENAPRQL